MKMIDEKKLSEGERRRLAKKEAQLEAEREKNPWPHDQHDFELAVRRAWLEANAMTDHETEIAGLVQAFMIGWAASVRRV
jgi:hypothetical protein